MGSPEAEPCRELLGTDETQHQVTLTHPFQIWSTEVTFEELQQEMGYGTAEQTCQTHCPAKSLTWHEAAAYCNALSVKSALTPCYSCTGIGDAVACVVGSTFQGAAIYDCPGYRLPTEAEWEYAYRAGTTDAYYSGPNDPLRCSDYLNPDVNAVAIGWYAYNAYEKYHPGAQKQPNGFGLFDMAGNAAEWVHDGVDAYPTEEVTNPVGTNGSGTGVVRGGYKGGGAADLRAAARRSQQQSDGGAIWPGLRCARSL
jgi:formylglycine-generating enzyme required for sulfatase activity